jgi:tight adherence protein B
MIQIIPIAIAFSVGIFMLIILYYSYKNYKKQKLIQRLQRQMITQQAKPFSLLEMLGYEKVVAKTGELLRRAGFAKLNPEDTLLSFIVILVLIFAVLTIAGAGLFSLIIPVLLAVVVPWTLSMIATSRYNKLNRQFADAAQDMADYLKLVPNLENAIREVSATADNPLRGELEKVLHKLDLGIGMIPALKDFAVESESTMIDFWVDSIVFAYQMRASVADVCEQVSKKVKARLKQNAQVSAKMSEIKSMMYSIGGVMVALLVMVYSSSPEYLNSFNTLWGQIALIYTIVSYTGSTLYILHRINKEVSSL